MSYIDRVNRKEEDEAQLRGLAVNIEWMKETREGFSILILEGANAQKKTKRNPRGGRDGR